MLDLSSATDEQLVLRVADGDASALEVLYDRYVRQCFGLALRMLGDGQQAEEVVQEVFTKVWGQPSSYSAEKGRFASWLLSMVHHRCIDELRRRKPQVPLETPETGGFLASRPDPQPGPVESVLAAEQQRKVHEALQQIPPNQRQLLELAYFGGLSQSQIAARIGQPLGTVKTRMRMGLQQLRKLLEGEDLLLE